MYIYKHIEVQVPPEQRYQKRKNGFSMMMQMDMTYTGSITVNAQLLVHIIQHELGISKQFTGLSLVSLVTTYKHPRKKTSLRSTTRM
jgi:hypothetical protein